MKYKCDSCQSAFEDSEVVLHEFVKNVHFVGNVVLVKNRVTGKIYRTLTDKLEDGDCSLHCPNCGQVHLFGFNQFLEPSGVAV